MPTEHVLVVDDDPAILVLCHRILEADGYTVVGAKRGEEALAKLESEPFDLLLTDIRLPGLNGLDVTERLRERGLELTVVTMTGYSNMEMAIKALSLGVDEFIVKPFTPDTLRIHVSRALEKARLRRENTRLRTLVPLLDSAQQFSAARTREQVSAELFAAVRQVVNPADLALFLASPDAPGLTCIDFKGAAFAALSETTIPLTLPDAPWMHRVQYWNRDETPPLSVQVQTVGWLVSVPLLLEGKLAGLILFSTDAEPTAGDVETLQLVAIQASGALKTVDLLSELSHAYVNARELERVKSEFINITGHELRTPLAVVLGYATLLRERLDGDLREYADQVVNHAARLRDISDDMLNLAHFESGQIALNLENCALDQVVRQVVNSYRPFALERHQSIETRIESRAGVVHADRAMLDLMLGSLISNAIKFSPPSSQVRVVADGDAEQVTLSVRDQGKGLMPDEAARVFDAFYQSDSALTRHEGGLGLGLTLTREMVQAHGGKIWVETDRDQGSAFYISLPRENIPAG